MSGCTNNIHEVNVIDAKSRECPWLLQAKLAVNCSQEEAEMGEPNVAGSWDGMALFKDWLGDTSEELVLVDIDG